MRGGGFISKANGRMGGLSGLQVPFERLRQCLGLPIDPVIESGNARSIRAGVKRDFGVAADEAEEENAGCNHCLR